MGKRIDPGSIRSEKGMVLVTALLLLAVLTILGTAYFIQTSTDIKISTNFRTSREAFYAAEAAVEYRIEKLDQALRILNLNLNFAAPVMTGFTFVLPNIQPPTSTQRVLTEGNFTGLTAFGDEYIVEATANGANNASCTIEARVENTMIPVFQFGIFYENDLEMLPGANMTFSGGRIHSNNDIYMNPDGSATLTVDSIVTSAGDIYHRRKDRTGTTGTVRIKDGEGNDQNMTVDSDSTPWQTESQELWDGRVKTDVHGVEKLNLPMPSDTPRDILSTGTEGMFAKAGLKIINGTGYDKSGNVVELKYLDLTHVDGSGNLIIDAGCDGINNNVNPIQQIDDKFYDQREGRPIDTTVIDMEKLLGNATVLNKLNDPPADCDSGILYIASTNQSIEIIEGADLSPLSSTGLTVATNNPLYLEGDYNSTGTPVPASVIADAVTVLSNNWNDGNSTSTNLDDRLASNTIVNAAIMAGNRETVVSDYSGGVENFIRFLEKWSGKTLTYSGSLVCLWQSEQATEEWHYGSPVYTAPNRIWSYGIDPTRLPPGTPRVRTLTIKSWRVKSQEYI